MVKTLLISILLIGMVGCAQIKPMELPAYYPPDLSSIKRPVIDRPAEGIDYTIDEAKGTVTYTLSGQNKLTAKVTSEAAAWQIVDTLKQMIDVQSELIKQKDQLIITIDLQRQYAERGKTYAEIQQYAAEVIAIIVIIASLF